MKKTIKLYDFQREFEEMDRKDNFSYEGLEALYNWLDEVMGDDFELDVIALCCEFTEYENMRDFWKNYDEGDYPDIETIEEHTNVILIDNSLGFIIQDF